VHHLFPVKGGSDSECLKAQTENGSLSLSEWGLILSLDHIDTERVKLLANWFDRASTAMLTIGVFAPLAAAIYGPPAQTIPALVYAFGCVFWFSGAYLLHWLARRTLGGLL